MDFGPQLDVEFQALEAWISGGDPNPNQSAASVA
jgi:hypothetical protein